MAELKRSEVGNQATETSAFERGSDAGSIGVSEVPHSRPVVEVDVEYVEDGVALSRRDGFKRGLGELQEGPTDQLSSMLLEEPDETGLDVRYVNGVVVEARPERLDEISRRGPREQLVWYGYSADGLSAVLGDRVDILKDVLESAYSCKECRGTGKSGMICGLCDGLKYEGDGAEKVACRGCIVLGFGMEQLHASGYQKCEKCSGSGWKGGVVIPEQAQQEAVTGIVVSVGPQCRLLKIGDRVVHSKYAGHTLKMSEDNSIVTMRESEVLKILRQR
jgi:co-chaperonin GroES (HSP10)